MVQLKLKLKGSAVELIEGIELLREHLGFEINKDGVTLETSRCESGFCVLVTGEAIEIRYDRSIDFYRAFAIALDVMKKQENTELRQTASFDSCGIMIDLSRRAVLKLETIKKIMINMACMGLNRILLYMEDTYELEGYPYFGYMRGRYSKNEIKEIVKFGNMLGIETVPCIQTLAHLVTALKWNAFADVRDTWDILLVGEKKTYDLIEDMIRTMRECFTTSTIHIGMDEAHDVGLGQYLEKHGYTDRLKILCDHLTCVTAIAEKYGFSPMMWSDMLFSLAEKKQNSDLPDNIAEMLPDGITQVYWDYYSRSEKHYDQRVLAHKKMGCPIVFAGGIWTWSGPSVNYVQTFESTLPALKVCKKNGIKQVFATLWGDDGAECDVQQALYGMQLYAEINYNENLSKKNLDKMFKTSTGCDAEAFLLLDTENYYEKNCSPEICEFEDESGIDGILTFSKQVLYQNPMLGLFDKNFEGVNLKRHYMNLYEKLENINIQNGFESIFECNKQLVKVLAEKCDIGIRIKIAYDDKNMQALSAIVKDLARLSDDIERLYSLREALWYKNNKPFGFEAVGCRLAGVASMVRTARNRIIAFLNGDIDSLLELETERLYYNSADKPFVWEFTGTRIMMP